MQTNNSVKPTVSKNNIKKKNNLGIVTPKVNLFLKHLSKNIFYLNSIIISIGFMLSVTILGIANYFDSVNWKVSFIPLIIAFIVTFLLSVLKNRLKKIKSIFNALVSINAMVFFKSPHHIYKKASLRIPVRN
jgi:hypothetical protein